MSDQPPAKGARYFSKRDAIFASDLRSVEKLVLLAILAHVNVARGEAFPSVERLVKLTSLCERSVRAAIKSLRLAGWLKVRKLYVGGKQQCNRYRVRVPERVSASPDVAT